MTYIELHSHSYFSLLDGVPSPEELVKQASKYEMPAIALTDHNGLYGLPRLWQASQKEGIKAIVGCEITLENQYNHITLLAENEIGYSNLCRLITLSHPNNKGDKIALKLKYLTEHSKGLIALSGCKKSSIVRSLSNRNYHTASHIALKYSEIFEKNCFFLEMQNHHEKDDYYKNFALANLGNKLDIPIVATGNVHYINTEDAPIHDVLTCIKHKINIEHATKHIRNNHEYYFRKPQHMQQLFKEWPKAIENTLSIAERCNLSLPYGPQILPKICFNQKIDSNKKLNELCLKSLLEKKIHNNIEYKKALKQELKIISQNGLADYFLIVWDLICFANRRKILCQGRGSAANSLVSYLLGITPIDPLKTDLVFERFLSKERTTTPDIDIDFASDRREEVIQYIHKKYGANNVSMACTIVTFQVRSAIRDVGLVLGFKKEILKNITSKLDDHYINPSIITKMEPYSKNQKWKELIRISNYINGFPRHIGTHNGGTIISNHNISNTIPIESTPTKQRTVVQWDKDSLETMKWIKLDILGLRILSAINDTCSSINPSHKLENINFDDQNVFHMICQGETIGIFQIESQAQTALIPRFQPKSLNDLTIQIALIRPGPLQAKMVEPYLLRRENKIKTTYLHPLLKPSLKETLGIILFQEQVIKIARDIANFTPGEGELLRKHLSSNKLQNYHKRFIGGAESNGIKTSIANQIFDQLKAFGSYSFSKAHASSFAVITYWSAWLRYYYPTEFFLGLLRNQPMGFYPEHVLISDAQKKGVCFLPVDLRYSQYKSKLESGKIRLGLNTIKKIGESHANIIVQTRKSNHFKSLSNIINQTNLPKDTIESLIMSGSVDYLNPNVGRRQILWESMNEYTKQQQSQHQQLFTHTKKANLKPMNKQEKLESEFKFNRALIKHHPTYLYRKALAKHKTTFISNLKHIENGKIITIAGIIIKRQSPPTARGIHFITLEDQTGIINVIIYPYIQKSYLQEYFSKFVIIEGKTQHKHGSTNFIAQILKTPQ